MQLQNHKLKAEPDAKLLEILFLIWKLFHETNISVSDETEYNNRLFPLLNFLRASILDFMTSHGFQLLHTKDLLFDSSGNHDVIK